MRNHIFLTGFMGSGKSYWGRLLAEEFRRPFIDLDDWIAARHGKNIADIFAEAGEDGFRRMERDCLHELKQQPDTIVAAGGGTPCFFDNLDWMKKHGSVIYLKTPVSVLMDRLKAKHDQRPLLADLEDDDLQRFIEKLLADREPFYLGADLIAGYDPEAEGAILREYVGRMMV